MITHLSGALLASNERFIVVDVGGVGYKIRVTLDTLHALRKNQEQKVSLWTHLVVREDALDLYGFRTEQEMEFFELLISVSGIGPKSALGILNVAPLEHLREAIVQGDTGTLTKVSGIGSKGAQKIILELRDKLGGYEVSGGVGSLKSEHDAIEALCALGYSEREAREALKAISPDTQGTSARVKEALKRLGK